jgi:hypothetical protein
MLTDFLVELKFAAGASAAVQQIPFRSQSTSSPWLGIDAPSGVFATADKVIE